MANNDTEAETRTATLSEARAGLKFQAGHRVVLVISDAQARRAKTDAPAESANKKIIQGSFLVGDHVMKAATFRLHKDSGDGPLVTPDTLAGGSTELTWTGDHWVTGDDGKYKFIDLADGKYFVELFSEEPSPKTES